MKKRKLAIVCSGGGMRCAYTGGFLTGYHERFPADAPDILIAASGGAGSAAYYLTGQLREMRTIWTESLATRRFVNAFRLWKIMDIDYVIDEVFRVTQKLDIQELVRSPVDWQFAITEKATKAGRYISKKDVGNVDILEVLRASIALPIVYGRSVKVGDSLYIDGVIGTSFRKMIERAISLGATHIIAIDASRKHTKHPIPSHYDGVKLMVVKNSRVTAGRMTVNPKVLTATFDLGYQDAMKKNYL